MPSVSSMQLMRGALLAAMMWAHGAALAQAPINVGKREYDNNCAVCHGQQGKGDGPLAGIVNKRIPDLTVLARSNGGVFPVQRVYEMIDGRVEVAGHGSREMPVWGRDYDEKAGLWVGPLGSPGDYQAWVRGRILALVEHLNAFQAK